MKAQTSELIDILILVVGVSVLLVISNFIMIHIPGIGRERVNLRRYERLSSLVDVIFFSKLPFIEKTLAQLIGDSIEAESDLVYYGEAYHSVNVTEIVEDVLNFYFNEYWHLEITSNEGKKLVDLGYDIKTEELTTFNFPMPIPSNVGETVEVSLYVW